MPLRASHLAATLLSGLLCVHAPAQSGLSATLLDGRHVALFPPRTRAVVLFFIATDCPISNRYQPEMTRLEHEFTPHRVTFWFVYPNLTETAAGIRAHLAEYARVEAASHVLLDPGFQLVKLAAARTTPQAAILLSGDGNPRPVYSGRIDDRYLSIGNERPQATRHDLEDSIAAALAGRPVPPPAGPAVGCGIVTAR